MPYSIARQTLVREANATTGVMVCCAMYLVPRERHGPLKGVTLELDMIIAPNEY